MTNYLSEGKVPYFISKLYGNIPVASHEEVDELYARYVDSVFPKPVTYALTVDESNSDPESAVVYVDNTAGHGIGWDAWKDEPIYRDIKPCVVKDGEVQYYLNPDDYTQKADGSPAVITGGDGDVMVEIPKCGYNFSRTDDGLLKIELTDEPEKEGFCYLAHSLEDENDCDYIYVGAYLASGSSDGVHSYSGATPYTSVTLTNFRSYVKKSGDGYQPLSFYVWTLIQVLYLMAFKNRDSQTAIGRGDDSISDKASVTGYADKAGMCGLGETVTSVNYRVAKCLGMESLWGYYSQWCDGIGVIASPKIIFTDFTNFQASSTISRYRYQCQTSITSNITSQYIKTVQGTNNGGFVVSTTVTSSSTKNWCDYGGMTSTFAVVGGYKSSYAGGLFCCLINNTATQSDASISSRIVYKHKDPAVAR